MNRCLHSLSPRYVGEDDPLPLCERFVSGFVQHGDLTPQEVEAIPDLINLRIFSNAVYFTVRGGVVQDRTTAYCTVLYCTACCQWCSG